jgi:hypothetical protein
VFITQNSKNFVNYVRNRFLLNGHQEPGKASARASNTDDKTSAKTPDKLPSNYLTHL